jgi:hypothetical protein
MNSEYKPTTTEDKVLFTVKQTYMFAVFEKTLLTDQGKAYVREFEKESADAQSIYRRISEYAIKSTKASLKASTILSYITSCKLGEGSAWRGPMASFVLHWQNQVRLYEAQVEKEEYFSNGQKRHMLQNAVHPVQELRAVKTQADQHKTQTGKELTYDQYVNLLLSAASAYYDAQFAPKTHFAARAPRRAVYSHDITESSDGNDPAYDIDCALGIVQPKSTHFAARTPRRVVYSHNIKESNDDNDPAYDIDWCRILSRTARHPLLSVAEYRTYRRVRSLILAPLRLSSTDLFLLGCVLSQIASHPLLSLAEYPTHHLQI